MKEARFFEKLEDKRVRCLLCPHRCFIGEGKRGSCGVRENQEGVLFALTYGKIASLAMDPIEKKPLYHFLPGASILSLGSVGCNLHCLFCQNWEISQSSVVDFPLKELPPQKAVELALRYNSVGIAYTYNEPFVFWEYVFDTASLTKKEGLVNVLVTNGYVEEQPLEEILPLIDAMNIDLKSFDENFYKKVCGGKLEPVLRTIELAYRRGVHIEITHLLIGGLNDDFASFEKMINWISELSPDIPLHISRYFPAYRLNLSPTPLSLLQKAYEIALQKLHYVYLGNVLEERTSTTYCPSCGNAVIRRSGYRVSCEGLKGNRCAFCGQFLPIVVKQ
ncbi:MAG: AmmeMemoRadiSam system radical SAM enzyme [Candidatus Atribacteria bacterium]|nr:AmmeMemoRadiSam system radical SAM enzyme [Candidatus Atribacteria bacterium]MCD6349964.1 AmmeMemoRadiSam system radical SAM enzyme [Candidatus Atribacteria bacterium]